MNINQFIGVKSNEELTYEQKYDRLIEKLGGLENLKIFLPFSLKEIKEAYEKDKHLNNLPLSRWDAACGFFPYVESYTDDYKKVDSRFNVMLKHHSITSYSRAQLVNLLKRVAVRSISE